MRVTNKMLYDVMQLRLGRLTEALKDSNDIVTTGKRINKVSDDPTGTAQLLNIRASLESIVQFDRNMDIGATWLTGGETALDSANTMILDTKLLITQLINSSNNPAQRLDAVERIDGMLQEMVSLSNMSVNGSYIFGGTKTDLKPFVFDNPVNPQKVNYRGNHTAFEIKSDKSANLAVGRDGSTIFWEDYLVVDYSNNKIDFTEETGLGPDFERVLTGILPDGSYTASELAVAVQNAMSEASEAAGHGIEYQVGYDSEGKEFSIQANGASHTGYLSVQLLFGTGREASVRNVSTGIDAEIRIDSVLADAGSGVLAGDVIDFTLVSGNDSAAASFVVDADNDTTRSNFLAALNSAVSEMDSGDLSVDSSQLDAVDNMVRISSQKGEHIQLEDSILPLHTVSRFGASVTVHDKEALLIGTPPPPGSAPFRLSWEGEHWTVSNDPGYGIPEIIAGTENHVDIDLNQSGTPDISVTLSTPVNEAGDYIEFDILPALGEYSIGSDLGFETVDVTLSPPVSDRRFNPITGIIIDGTNNSIDFQETDFAGVSSGVLSAIIPPGPGPGGEYADPDALAAAIKAAMEAASTAAVTYDVSYDPDASRFIIKDAGLSLQQLDIFWNTGPNAAASAAAALGYYDSDDQMAVPVSDFPVILFTIDSTNSRIDFQEVTGGVTTDLSIAITNGGYTDPAVLAVQIETQMEAVSAGGPNSIDYSVSYDGGTRRFTIEESTAVPGVLDEMHLLWNSGPNSAANAADMLGYDRTRDDAVPGVTSFAGSTDVVLTRIDHTNGTIDFQEFDLNGNSLGEIAAVIPPGGYTSLAELASAIEGAMEAASSLPEPVDYSVTYDGAGGRFIIRNNGDDLSELRLLWGSGRHQLQSAASSLGFDAVDDIMQLPVSDRFVVDIEIDDTNNKIDFREIMDTGSEGGMCELCATIPNGRYTDMTSLVTAVETAMNGESANFGHNILYDVSFDGVNNRIVIKEAGAALEGLDLLWGTGKNVPASAAGVLGFDPEDDITLSGRSSHAAEWGIFNTLFDLKGYLETNDVNGLDRSLTRLDKHFEHMSSQIADIGIKSNRIEVKQKMNMDLDLRLTDRASNLEDADIIKAVMELQSNQMAYEAALRSSTMLLELSLADYL